MYEDLSLEHFMEGLIKRNPSEPEFHQAVYEVAATIIPYIADKDFYKDAQILERMTEPDRIIIFRVTWEDDKGSVFGHGIPYLMRHAQRVVNSSWLMLLDNAGLTAGPQIVLNREMIRPAAPEEGWGSAGSFMGPEAARFDRHAITSGVSHWTMG